MKSATSTFFLWGLLLVLSSQALAQGPSVWHITEEQGLPSQVLYSVVQDSIGYLWFATENGIAKFDGQRFTTIEDSRFPLGEVLSLRIDPLGRIWFLGLSGRLGYILENRLYGFTPDEFMADIEIIDFIWTDHSMWVNTKQSNGYQFFRYDLIGDSVAHQASYKRFEKKDSRRLFLFENGSVGSFTKNIIHRYSSEKQEFEHWFSTPSPLKSERVFSFDQGYFFLITGNRLFCYRDETLREVPISVPIEKSNMLYKQGNLALITGKRGISQYLISDSLWKHKAVLLPQVSPNFIFRDREGNFWIGGNGSGLWMIPNLNVQMYQSVTQANEIAHVGCFAKLSDKSLLVGYQNGELGRFELKEDSLLYSPLPFKAREGDFRFIHQLPKDGSYLVVENDRLSYLSADFARRWQFTDNVKAIGIFQDTLWMANHLGIARIAAGAALKPLFTEPALDKNDIIRTGRTYRLLSDQDRLWIGTIKGLYYYKNGRVHAFQGLAANPNFRIADMITDEQRRLYIATRGNGLALVDQGQLVRQYNTSDGLSSNQCFKLALSDNYLWIATDKGLNRLHLPTGEIQIYNKYDGLPSNEILDLASLSNHRIVVGTTKGVAVFPDTINPIHALAPTVHLNEIRINGNPVEPKAFHELGYQQNNLEFQYIALHFRSRGNLTYFYRLKGLEEEWTETESRSVRFNALAPGNYEFQIYSKTEDGVSSPCQTTVSFHIATPFWQEWWFILGLAMLLVGLTWLFVTIRFRQIRKKELLERTLRERINELRTRALQTQMNPHFVFNALNTVQHSISANEPEKAMVTLSKFAQLIRMIFEQSKEKEIRLDRELEFLRIYLDFEQMRFGSRVRIDLEIAPELAAQASTISIPPLLIQPVIENAFKHGLLDKETNGDLQVHFEQVDHCIRCSIEDNGVGRAYSAQKKTLSGNLKHRPSGLRTTAERLAILHNSDTNSSSYLKVVDLFDRTGRSAGTRVILLIPMHNTE